MNQQLAEAVRQLPLNPIVDPAPVSWWPPAIGWWILMALSILVVFLLWFVGYRRYLKPVLHLRRQRRQLRRELRPLLQTDALGAAPSINTILKAHMLRLGHDRCKTLTGLAWQEFLATKAELKPAEAEALAPLGDASYRAPIPHSQDRANEARAFRSAVMLLASRLSPGSVPGETSQASGNG